jgi:hypothetical protein
VTDHPVDRESAADAAIDRAVREIMSAEPRPGFRQRVLARLDTDVERPGAALRALWTRVSLAAAAAAVVVGALLWTRPIERVPETTVAVTEPPPASPPPRTDAPSKPAPPRSAAPPSRRNPATALRTGTPEPRLVQAASIDADVIAEDGLQIEPLRPPAGLLIQKLEASEPSIPEIVIESIAISEITLTPLPPGGR